MKQIWNNKNRAPHSTGRSWYRGAALFTMAMVLAAGGMTAALDLTASAQGLAVDTVEAVVRQEPEQAAPTSQLSQSQEQAPAADTAPAAPVEETAPAAAEAPAQQPAEAPDQEAQPEEAPQPEAVPELPTAQAPDQENSVATLAAETPELAAQDPEAAPAVTDAEENASSGHAPEGSVLLTPEQIREALDSGALTEVEAQCIDWGGENGFFGWLWDWLFGGRDREDSGWVTKGGKTYYYDTSTHKKVVGIQTVDGKLYYFDADGVMQKDVTFGVDVSKYQTNLDWKQLKKSGVSFAIIRIGYRGYGAAGTLVKDPMFEEHFTNARNAGLKVGVYFFTQAVNENEAREEAQGCNWALNGRKLDYPIYYDTEASTSSNGTGRADGLGKEDRTKCAVAFCEEVKALGYEPGVYASTNWFRSRVDLDVLRQYTLWNAHYGVASSPIECDVWQGTEKARINGYNGQLDANISYRH